MDDNGQISAFSGKDKCRVLAEYISTERFIVLLLMDILMTLCVYSFPLSLSIAK